jgi:hypothetical protein
MITDIEKEQLDRIREHEEDFYAELLFLAMYRPRAAPGLPTSEHTRIAREIADTVLGVYTDINARTME